MCTLGLLAACSTKRAYSDWVLREPVAARFGLAERPAALQLPMGVELGSVRAAEGVGVCAGNISDDLDPRPVPFAPGCEPVEVLRRDVLAMLGGDPTQAPRARLDLVVERAFVRRTYYFFRSSELVGEVVLTAQLKDVHGASIGGPEVIRGTFQRSPDYITSDQVEEILARAYAQALDRLGSWLESIDSTTTQPAR